jgi:outer membrane protein TolC
MKIIASGVRQTLDMLLPTLLKLVVTNIVESLAEVFGPVSLEIKRFIFLILFVSLLVYSVCAHAQEIKPAEVMSLDKCIDIALRRNPNIQAARSTVGVNESRIGENKANYYPQVTATGGYTKAGGTSLSVVSSGFTVEGSLSQNIYDFGKTSSLVESQKYTTESTRMDLSNVESQTVLTVKSDYYGVLQARRNEEVAAEVVKQFEQHLDQANAFYKAGTKAKIDVTKAEVDLSNSRLAFISAQNTLRIAWVNLNNAMGVPNAPAYDIEDNLTITNYALTYEEALSRAFQNRPDLLSLLLKEKAARSSIETARTNYYPYITGSANYGYSGDLTPFDHYWTAGATVTFPVFSGFLTKYQVQEQEGNLSVLEATAETLRQSIMLDVQQGYLNLQQSKDAITTAETAVRQAQENLDLANGRYKSGVGSPLEVTDALVSYSNAKTSYNNALASYKIAEANIEKAIGAPVR